MKSMTKIFVLILSLCMLVGVASISSFAAVEDIVMDVDVTEAELGDKITVTISNDRMTFRGMTLKLSFDNTIVKCVEMYDYAGYDADDSEGDLSWLFMQSVTMRNNREVVTDERADVADTVALTNSDAKFQFGMVPGRDTTYKANIIVKLVFEVIGEGEFTFDLETVVVDETGETEKNDKVDITIGASAPSCNHSTTELAPNVDGKTHNEVCTACGEPTVTNVLCSGTDDNDCTTAVTCKCGNVVTAAKDAHVAGEDDGDCTTAVKCVNCEKNAVEAKEKHTGGTATCTAQAKCEVCGTAYGDLADHSFLDNICGTQLTDGDCVTPATYATMCDNCDYEDKAKVITGEKDPTNHAGEQVFAYWDPFKHQIGCSKCEEIWDENNPEVPHEADKDGNCVCGAFAVVMDFNGGKLNLTPPVGMDEEYWKDMLEAEYGSLDATFSIGFTEDVYAVGVNEIFLEMLNLQFVKDGYKLVGIAYDAEGKNLYEGEDITESTTMYFVWESTHVCAYDTLTYVPGEIISCESGYEGYYSCSCGKYYEDADAEREIPDLTAWKAEGGRGFYVPGHVLALYIERDYHQSICCVCLTVFGEPEPHDYTTGEDPHTCICGRWFTGWDGDCYYEDAVLQKTGWTEIGDAWYYLDPETGVRAEGLTRVPYATDYAPNAEDLAYWEANKDTSKYSDAETAVFYFDANGKFLNEYTGIVDGNRFAVNGCVAWHVGMVEIEGEYYYFKGDENGNGNIMATGEVYATRDFNSGLTVGEGVIYNFTEGGEIITNDGIVKDTETGKLYYYENNRLMKGAGLVKLEDGNYIFVRTSGELAVGQYWVSANKTNDLPVKGGKCYTFDENGYLQNAIDPSKDGIIDGVYYKQGEPYYAGLIEIDGATYYVNSSGKVVTGEYYVTKTNGNENIKPGTKLIFGEDGKMQPIKNGIVEENGVLYYYENNCVVYGKGVVEQTDDEGKIFYIYVKSNGQLATGKYWPTTRNGLLESGEYDWGTDGKYYPAD